ncbi:L-xylulose reductase-like [Centruroides vittatus]|uniref:L-xylulose reductase-like n=1 Tax=Centruroides vittatus TaxID=120091 RepID=UPI0035101E45
MDIKFHGERALVTGAGRGIGRALAKKLVECGAQVVALSKTQANLDSLKAEVPSIHTVCVDLANWDETKKAVQGLGDIDLLVNNAAFGIINTFGTIGPEDFDKIFAVNVKAVINVSQIAAEGMKKKRKGAIVNVSSQAGMVGMKDHALYGASKGALDQLTRIMALELGPYQIRVNSVNPTVVMTEMAKVGWSDPVKAADMKSKIPLGRFCDPEHVVNGIIYLLSDKADMINGAILPIDGGFTAC